MLELIASLTAAVVFVVVAPRAVALLTKMYFFDWQAEKFGPATLELRSIVAAGGWLLASGPALLELNGNWLARGALAYVSALVLAVCTEAFRLGRAARHSL